MQAKLHADVCAHITTSSLINGSDGNIQTL